MAKIPAGLETLTRTPLDNKYWVDNSQVVSLNTGLMGVGQQRFSKSDDTLWILLSTGWKQIGYGTSTGGNSPAFTIGTVTTGTTPKVTITGSSTNPALNFVLPRGEKGQGATIVIDRVEPSTDGVPHVINIGDATNAIYVIKLPMPDSCSLFTPILTAEVNAQAQGIVGKCLRDSIIWLANRGGTTPAPPASTTYTSTQTYTASCGQGFVGTPVTKQSTKTSTINQETADQLALADATQQAKDALVCTPGDYVPPVNGPVLRTILTGPSQDEPTGTQLTASDGDIFKFESKALGDGTGKLMYLTINGTDVVGAVDFLVPYLTRIDGGVGGELFSFKLATNPTIYYGRFKDFGDGLVTLSTSYNI
jgi:hypothetical protein